MINVVFNITVRPLIAYYLIEIVIIITKIVIERMFIINLYSFYKFDQNFCIKIYKSGNIA
jgi:hypothetical protein